MRFGGATESCVSITIHHMKERERAIMFGDMTFMTIGVSLNITIMVLVILTYYIGRLSREENG